MRIGLNAGIPQLPDPQQPSTKSGSPAVGGSSELSAGSAKFSWDESRAQSLSAAAGELPEVRQERVAALAQRVSSGTYAVTAEQTAEALMAHMNEAA
jgi:flagellar biosynthesis anti-sigma factor FlgM